MFNEFLEKLIKKYLGEEIDDDDNNDKIKGEKLKDLKNKTKGKKNVVSY